MNSKRSRHSDAALSVVDMFCGGGGLSAGFEQAGFRVILGLDNDEAAVRTFNANHPESRAKKVDLRSADPELLPPCDVIVGGPPCTQFSTSKSNKTRNVLDGLELVQSFLRTVYFHQPKFWVMENVAAIQKYLPDEIPLSWIGIDAKGSLEVPNKVELVAADFGVPQKRVRYLIGNFPTPEQTHTSAESQDLFNSDSCKSWRTLGDALGNFPDPLGKRSGLVSDPNYGFELDANLLSDHFYDTRLDKNEIRALRKAKEQHPYMGFMPFVEDPSRPARTVVATQLGRETLVVERPTGVFRRLTVRECAVLQTFPLSFQFSGNSYSAKYRLVGNAVPPMLSFHIANQILKVEQGRTQKQPKVTSKVYELAPPPDKPFRNGKSQNRFFENRKFSESLPGKEQRGCRCEFSNEKFVRSERTLESYEGDLWGVKIFVGEGRKCREYELDIEGVERIFNESDLPDELRRKILGLKSQIEGWLDAQNSLSGAELQSEWGNGDPNDQVYGLVDGVSAIVDSEFPRGQYHHRKVKTKSCDWFPAQGIRLRILLGALAGNLLANRVNQRLVS